MSKILYISPNDNTLKFINKIYKHISKLESVTIEFIELEHSDKSHKEAIEAISKCSTNDLIIFSGHGGSDFLQGSVDSDNDNYKKEKFIDNSNIQILKDKKFISISCNSSDKLGKMAKENGVISFMGFGDLPTDNEVIKELDKPLPEINAKFKGELSSILKKSIYTALEYEYTFVELQSLIRFYANKSMIKILKTKMKHKEVLADRVFNIAYECKIFGSSFSKLT